MLQNIIQLLWVFRKKKQWKYSKKQKHKLVGGFNHLEKVLVSGKDSPIYYLKKNMFETTNQTIYVGNYHG